MTEPDPPVRVLPLERYDPPSVGQFTLTGRLEVTDSGTVYAGVGTDGDEQVAVVLLSAGAETDSYARARFHDSLERRRTGPEAATQDVQDTQGAQDTPDGAVIGSEEEPDIAPWAAVRAADWSSGLSTARSLLAPVALEDVPGQGAAKGPGFRPHWFRRRDAGRWRVWPLPWPSALTMAGRWTYLASFALVLAIAALALFIAVKVFQNKPPAPVPPPYPQPTQQRPSQPTPTPNSPSPTPTPSPSSPTPSNPTGPPGTTGPTVTGPGVPPIV
ncbi:MAG: hypothetical protein ACRDQA_13580 [Nocardioidaceae bacterium]